MLETFDDFDCITWVYEKRKRAERLIEHFTEGGKVEKALLENAPVPIAKDEPKRETVHRALIQIIQDNRTNSNPAKLKQAISLLMYIFINEELDPINSLIED